MTFSDVLNIAGLFIGSLSGVWTIYLSVRRTKYPASLTFVQEQTVALLDDFATRIPNLSVFYKDNPIDKSVVLLSGYLVNDGDVDITPKMTERPLSCELPIGCKWLEFKLTGAAEALSATGIIKSPEALELNFGLFRRDEAFSFQALVLVDLEYGKKKPITLAKALRWSHRIEGMGVIKTKTLPTPEALPRKENWFLYAISLVMIAIFFSMGFLQTMSLGPLGPVPYIAYERIEAGKTSSVRLTPNRDGTTTVADLTTGDKSTVNLMEYNKGVTIKPFYQKRLEPDWGMIISGIFIMLASLFLIYFMFEDDYKRYRLRKVLSVVTKET